MEQEM